MKRAKVRNGVIQHVWPWVKTLPDGTTVVKNAPPNAYDDNPCFIDVSDDVKPGFVWNEEKKAFLPKPKEIPPPKRDLLMEVVAEKLGITYEELLAEAKKKK